MLSQGRILLLTAALAGAALAAAASAPAADQPSVKMIDAWAYPQSPAAIRKDPSQSSPTVSRLHFTTELGNAEVYRVSATAQATPNSQWLRVDVLGRPNGRVGWVPESALGRLHAVNEQLVIVRAAERATLFKNDKRVWSAPVGIGKPGTPTPAGRFYIREGTRIKQGEGRSATSPSAPAPIRRG